jgi:hypothetical protein
MEHDLATRFFYDVDNGFAQEILWIDVNGDLLVTRLNSDGDDLWTALANEANLKGEPWMVIK